MTTLTVAAAELRQRLRRRGAVPAPRDFDAMLSLLRATLTGLHTLHRPVESPRAIGRCWVQP